MNRRGDNYAGAIFSDCEQYRYRLWRIWDINKPIICFLMLNPSTADEEQLDPTVTRCKRRAETLGYGGVEIANIFALRSTDPKALYEATDPVGKDNDFYIYSAVSESSMTVCAWGTHGAFQERGKRTRYQLSEATLHCMKINKDGTPAHPLYLPYSLQPILWSA